MSMSKTPIKNALMAEVSECRIRFVSATPGTEKHNAACRDLGKALRALDDYAGEPVL